MKAASPVRRGTEGKGLLFSTSPAVYPTHVRFDEERLGLAQPFTLQRRTLSTEPLLPVPACRSNEFLSGGLYDPTYGRCSLMVCPQFGIGTIRACRESSRNKPSPCLRISAFSGGRVECNKRMGVVNSSSTSGEFLPVSVPSV